jgi:peptide/nickel transport system permease protein
MATQGSSAPARRTRGRDVVESTRLHPPPSRPVWRRLKRNRRVIAGAAFLLALYLIALLAPLTAPDDPDRQVLVDRLQGPSWTHPAGTDGLGRDILSRAI